MALADWDVFRGGGLSLTTAAAYSGEKSLAASSDYAKTFLVHSQTYNDAPKEARIDTFVAVPIQGWEGAFMFRFGGVFRKQSGADTYYYIYAEVELDGTGYIYAGYAYAFKVVNGEETQINAADITDKIHNLWGEVRSLEWFMFRAELMEASGAPELRIYATPFNPSDPENELTLLFAQQDPDISIPDGGACGLMVGVDMEAGGSPMECYYDLTKLYY